MATSRWSCVLLAIALWSCASTQSHDLAGAWLAQPTAPGASPSLIIFERHGQGWNGTIKSQFGDRELRAIRLESDQVSYNVAWGASGRKVQFEGTFKNDKMHLVMHHPSGLRESVAHKASPQEVAAFEAAAELKKLALPALRNVPDNGLARTPPMGWNSWNKFAIHIDDKTVREIADAMVSGGLRDAGYVYVVIDDAWQGRRDANGVLHPNAKFPDMRALGEYIHSRGLKFGIYSSPGPLTCGGYVGSHGHEEQDAKMFAQWSVDYLKYDWCSARRLYQTREEMQALYQKMGEALQATGRPIVYALCQYGMFDVGKWGRKAGGNLWRTTFDIRDDWNTMSQIGLNQNGLEADARPGGWNDPDMLEVGNGGMSLDEYRTHMTLWSILAAPLLLGHDPRYMTPEIKALLTNKEVIAIDQDPLGKQGHRVLQQGETEVWIKALSDGSTAVALFNRGETSTEMVVRWPDLTLAEIAGVRDIWQQADLEPQHDSYRASVPRHGTVLLRVSPRR